MLKMLLTGAGTALLVVCLGVGWIWSVALKGINWIDAYHQVIVVACLTSILVVQQVVLVGSKVRQMFRKRKALTERKPIIKEYLTSLLNDYYTYWQNAGNEPVAIRINVMIPRIGFLVTSLRIFENACPPEIKYKDEEESLKWKEGQGACGLAWKYGDYRVYDSQNTDNYTLVNTLSKAQLRAIQGINAILSVPIKHENNIVGVLNVDSVQTMNKTKLTDDLTVFNLIRKYADDLGVHCYYN